MFGQILDLIREVADLNKRITELEIKTKKIEEHE